MSKRSSSNGSSGRRGNGADGKRSRVERRQARPLRRFLLLNILPLGAIATVGVLWYRGIIEVDRFLPPGADENLIAIFVSIGILFVVASLSLPAAHAVVKGVDSSFARRTRILAGNEEGSRIGALLLSPLLTVAYLIAWPLRFLLMVLSLLLIAVIIVFMVRLFQPEFAQSWVDRATQLRPSSSSEASPDPADQSRRNGGLPVFRLSTRSC